MTDFTHITDEDLWDRLAQVSGRDRLETLFALGERAFDRGDFGRAQTLFEEALDAAELLGDQQTVGRVLHSVGAAAFHAGRLPVAVARYGQAAQVYGRIGVVQQAGRSMLCQAQAYDLLDRVDDCLEAAQHAAGFAQQGDDDALAGQAWQLQAEVLDRLGRDRQVLAACAAARQHFQRAGLLDGVLAVDEVAFDAHLRLGQPSEAQRCASQCLELARLQRVNTAPARHRLAEVLYRRGKYAKAARHAQTAQQEYRVAGDLIGVAHGRWLHGKALLGLGRPEAALTLFQRAQVVFDAAGNTGDALRCRADQAIARHDKGQYRKAEKINRRLVADFAALQPDSPDAQWCAVRLLGDLLAQRRFADCWRTAEGLMGLWPEGATADTQTYRSLLGQWAWALHADGRVEPAVAMATHVINHTGDDVDDRAAANCYEVRGCYRLDQLHEDAVADLAHAISAHLALGHHDRASQIAELLAQSARDTAGIRPAA